jgi:hypothetical protein
MIFIKLWEKQIRIIKNLKSSKELKTLRSPLKTQIHSFHA